MTTAETRETRRSNMTDHEQTYRDFRWEVPAFYNFAVDTLGRWAGDPARLALWSIDEDGTEHKAPYKYPRQVVFVTELPKTTSGKIRRIELRERTARGRQWGQWDGGHP